MNRTELDTKRPQTPPADRQAALRETEQTLEAGRFRRQLDLTGDDATRNVRRRTSALAHNAGTQTQLFAEAAGLQSRASRTPASIHPPSSELKDVLVSIRDGFVGSVYFPFGRVRTTHKMGPTLKTNMTATSMRFNIKEAQSLAAFKSAVPDFEEQTLARMERYFRERGTIKSYDRALLGLHQKWMTEILQQPGPVPEWAQAVTGPDSVGRAEDARLDNDTVLFEIIGGRADGRNEVHLSRGMAARLPMTEETIVAIRAAVDLAERAGPPAERNRVFYNHLRENAPEFARMIREI